MNRIYFQTHLRHTARLPTTSRNLAMTLLDNPNCDISEIERQIARLSSPRRFNMVSSLAPQYRFAMVHDAVRLQEEYREINRQTHARTGKTAFEQPDYLRRERAIDELGLIIAQYRSLLVH